MVGGGVFFLIYSVSCRGDFWVFSVYFGGVLVSRGLKS